MIPFLLVASLAGCVNKQLGDPEWKEESVAWGVAVNGLQVGLAKREYPAGRAPGVGEVYLGLRLRTVSGRELKVLWPLKPVFGEPLWPLAGDESVAIELVYESGAGQKSVKFKPPNRPMVYAIRPGEERVMAVRLATKDLGVERFAEGTLLGVYENRQGAIAYGQEERVDGLWIGRAASGIVQVK